MSDFGNLGFGGGRAARFFALSISVVAWRLAILTCDTLALGGALHASGIALAVTLETV